MFSFLFCAVLSLPPTFCHPSFPSYFSHSSLPPNSIFFIVFSVHFSLRSLYCRLTSMFFLSYLLSSYLILSHIFLSYLIISHLISSYLISSYYFLSSPSCSYCSHYYFLHTDHTRSNPTKLSIIALGGSQGNLSAWGLHTCWYT